MQTKSKKVHYCDHCGKYYLYARFCLKHEKRCSKNPVNKRKCLEDCRFLKRIEIEYYTGDYDIENDISEHKTNCFECELTGQKMYHPSIEYKFWFDTYDLEYDQKPMPLICDIFEKSPTIFYNKMEK